MIYQLRSSKCSNRLLSVEEHWCFCYFYPCLEPQLVLSRWMSTEEIIFEDELERGTSTKYNSTWSHLNSLQTLLLPQQIGMETGGPIFVTFPASMLPFFLVNNVLDESEMGNEELRQSSEISSEMHLQSHNGEFRWLRELLTEAWQIGWKHRLSKFTFLFSSLRDWQIHITPFSSHNKWCLCSRCDLQDTPPAK